MTKGRTIIKGALILTLANLITRIMGFIYRIFMSNAIGARGMGVYQLIMPVYMLVFSLCASGLATVVSTCTAAAAAKGENGRIRRILHAALAVTSSLSIAACAAVFFGADFIAKNILHEPVTALSLKILSLCFPFMSTGACLRGYFCGMQKMGVPAAAQVTEQCIRIGVVWLLCGTMLSRGLEYACAMAVMGMAGGEIVSFLLTYLFYSLRRKTLVGYTHLSRRSAVFSVVSMSLPLTLNRGTTACLSALEHILIPQRLALHGMTSENAVSLFGGLCGMAVPLVMFPCSLLTALATAIMPAISEYSAKKDHAAVASLLKRAVVFTAVLGVFVSGMFITYPAEISAAVYGRKDIAAMLRLLGLVCPFLYTQIIMSAALNGMNFQKYIFKLGILSSCITLFAVWFLMPRYGIHAYIAGWAASAALTNRLCALKLEKTAGRFGLDISVLAKCIISAAFVCLFGRYMLHLFSPDGLVGMAVLTSVSGVLYLYLLEMLDVDILFFRSPLT